MKTVNRYPFEVNSTNLNEKYLNFASFNGLCDNKNFLAINQYTFEKCNNVYVDNNMQLSSRPLISKVDDGLTGPSSFGKILKVYPLGEITFYHVTNNGGLYRLYYVKPSTGLWTNMQVSAVIHCSSFKEFYYVFTSLTYSTHEKYRYKIDKSGNVIDDSYEGYCPITKIVRNGVVTNNDSINKINSAERTRYVVTYGQPTPVVSADAYSKKAIIQDETFDINLVDGTPITFTVPVATLSADLVTVSNNKVYLAYNYGYNYCKYSVDGKRFYKISFPDDVTDTPCMSDDGSNVWLYSKHYNGTLSKWECNAYVVSIPSVATDISKSAWNSISINLPAIYGANLKCSKSGYETFRLSTQIDSYSFYSSLSPYPNYKIQHSPEEGKFIMLIPATFTSRTYQNSVDTFSLTGSGGTSVTKDCYVMAIVYANGSSYACKSYGMTYLPDDGRTRHSKPSVRLMVSNGTFNGIYLWLGYNASIGDVNDSEHIYVIPYTGDYELYQYFEEGFYSGDGPPGNHNRIVSKSYHSARIDISGGYPSTAVKYYAIDCICKYINSTLSQMFKYSSYLIGNNLNTITTMFEIASWYSIDTYADKVDYSSHLYNYRSTSGIEPNLSENSEEYLLYENEYVKLSQFSDNILTSGGIVVNENSIPLLRRVQYQLYMIPLYVDVDTIIYLDTRNNAIYTNETDVETYIDVKTRTGLSTDFVPSNDVDFITKLYSENESVYFVQNIDELMYIPTGTVEKLSADITAMSTFTSTSVGIFLMNEVYELTYSDGNYYLNKTKIAFGCQPNSDVITSYNSSLIISTTKQGAYSLSYQSFVQSTEKVTSVITDAISQAYDDFYADGIKLCQYKTYIFMYKQNSKVLYVYDSRNTSWWKWTLFDTVTAICLVDENVIVVLNGLLYKFDFDKKYKYMDNITMPINWSFTTQKLHFNAPNNYKHISNVTIVADSDADKPIKVGLEFQNYRNIMNLPTDAVLRCSMGLLTTEIKKVNFMKTNAFQMSMYSLQSDAAVKFTMPNMSIKYRITERLR